MRKYLSLVKFAHTVFALPFALIGLFWGLEYIEQEGLSLDKPWYITLLLVIGCMITARNAAMAFNRYIDRKIDAKNERTAIREIPSGAVSEKGAKLFIWVNVLLFIAITWFINILCFALSPIAIAVVLGYSYTKRFTPLCHLILGLGLALAPVGAFLAVTAHFSLAPIILGIAVLTWVGGFDIIYALQDDTFDKENGLYSIPSFFGRNKALIISVALHCVSALCIIIFGIMVNAGFWYVLGAGIFIFLLTYQHIVVKPHDISRVNLAFFTTNGLASVIFGACSIIDWLI
ncbi:MAG: UbiA-like polyprenyltransferase [Bacteroidia bacterium]